MGGLETLGDTLCQGHCNPLSRMLDSLCPLSAFSRYRLTAEGVKN